MKKFLAILLTLALTLTLAGALTGCKKEVKPLRVLIDFPHSYFNSDDWLKNFKSLIAELGGPEDIEFEFLPRKDGFGDTERKMALTRLRTEIMAGQGPDVMLLSPSWDYENESYINTALFLMPEKIMENGLLMPLDKYIEKAQFMEWDRLTPAVMAAGYNETYGQVILPLSYTFPVNIYRASDLPALPEVNTQADMLESGDPILRDAAVHLLGDEYVMKNDAALSDPATRKLNFSEEELLVRTEEMYGLLVEYMQAYRLEDEEGIDDGVPEHYQTEMSVDYNRFNKENQETYNQLGHWWNKNYLTNLSVDEPLTMIPAYSPEGGVTAYVSTYACINASTKRPDDAFFILDVLLSPEEQRSSGMGIWTTDYKVGISVCEGLMNEENPVGLWLSPTWYMTDENYQEFCRVRDQITAARFYGTLDMELENIYREMWNSILAGREQIDLKTLVSQTYMRMRQEVSE